MKPKRPKRYKPDRLDASAITPELALAWRAPRFGTENPERMNNPLWEWLVKTRINAYSAGDRFGYPSPFDAGPAWCFARFGQSVTPLPDGRVILLAGEHEDSCDPDFHIYNDVTVYHPDGKLDLFGYPETVFPPTDFHTATLLDERIIVIGNLGYPDNRKAGITQIAELDLKTFAIRLIRSTGTPPGWIHKHIAELAPDRKSIQVRGGLIDPADKDRPSLLENPDAWSLDLGTWTWTRLTEHPWERHIFYAEGVRFLPLRQIGSLLSGQLYQPALPHTAIPEPESSDDEEADEEYDENGPYHWDEEDYSQPGDVFDGTRISVNGVTVRYKNNTGQVVLTIEGKLPPETVRLLIGDLRGKLEILLNRPVITRQL